MPTPPPRPRTRDALVVSNATPEARLGGELRRLRVRAGLSVRQLARELNRAHSSIVVYETGGRLAPVEVVEQYERFFDLAVGTLGAQRERARLERLEEPCDATLAANLAGDLCPYKGLHAFEPDDASLFFGREAQVEEVVARLATTRFAAIVGASGSGKSSFLRAGVLPRIAADGTHASVALLTPGENPLDALACAVDAATGGAALLCAETLRADPHALERAAGAGLVIAVDQLEELFTLCDDDVDRHRFLDALLAAWEDPSSPVVVIVALRADFYGHIAEHPGLSAAAIAHQSLLGPMTVADLRRAIELPAATAGLVLQRGLADCVLEDLAGEPGALPLLSHTLLETWKRRSRLMLTVAGYREAGGVRGAIAQTAEHTLRELDPTDRPIARTILLELTAIGEGAEPTPRRVDRASLACQADERRRVERVVDILAGARLLTLEEDSVEVAHEALIRHWPRLHAWIEEDRAGMLTRRRLTQAAREWEQLDRDPGALYRGAQLDAARQGAEQHARLGDIEREFLAASEAAQRAASAAARRRARRMHGLRAGLAALTATVAAVALFALAQRHEARRQAADATSLQLVVAAKSLLSSRPDVSLLLAFEAYRASPRSEARNALLAALRATRSAGALGVVRGQVEPIRRAIGSVAFSPRGDTLASDGTGGTVALWNLTRREPIRFIGDERSVESLAFSPDGKMLASGGADMTVRLWRVSTQQLLEEWPGHSELVSSVAFSPGGRLLASGSFDGTVRLWDVRKRAPMDVAPPRHSEAIASVAFSPDGRLLAYASFDGTVRVWDVRRRLARTTLRIRAFLSSVAFGSHGDTLAAGSTGGNVYLWDLRLPRPRASAPLSHHVDRVTSIAFTRDGRLLASASADKTIGLYDMRRKRFLAPLTGHRDWVTSVSFDRAGGRLASASNDGTVRVWNIRQPRGSKVLDSAPATGTRERRRTGPLQTAQLWRTTAELRGVVCRLVGTGLSRSEWIRHAYGIPYRRSCP